MAPVLFQDVPGLCPVERAVVGIMSTQSSVIASYSHFTLDTRQCSLGGAEIRDPIFFVKIQQIKNKMNKNNLI